MLNILKTKLKGWITNISLSTVIAGLISAQAELIPVFKAGADIELNAVSVVGLLGAIWGLGRKLTTAYKEA